jgi:hypothetical protein
MDSRWLREARAVAALIGRRVNLTIPSILAEGEPFALRVSVTGPDALPVDDFPHALLFEGSVGVDGLPASVRLERGASTARLDGLTARGPGAAVIRARVEGPAPAGAPGLIASNPAWVSREPAERLYWGDLHVHTRFSNCSGWRCLDPEWGYAFARDVSLLDFVAPADHLRGIASDPARWPRLQKAARAHDEPGRFATFLACESSHAQGFGGDNNVYYLDDDAPYFWLDRDDMRGIAPRVHLRELWAWLDARARPYFTVPHHTGRAAKYRSWDEDCYNPVREPLFEIYSSWGSSETRHTRLPISGGNNDAASYFVDALKAGARFGVIASSDDHATLPGSVHHFRTDSYAVPTLNGFAHKGLAAVRASRLGRAELFASLTARATYATTHARTLVEMRVGDATMGQDVPADASLRGRREVRVRLTLHGATAARVTLMRNGETFASQSLRGPELAERVNEVVFEDPEPFERAAVRGARFHPDPFLVYYARVEDANGAHQWTSPIWIG